MISMISADFCLQFFGFAEVLEVVSVGFLSVYFELLVAVVPFFYEDACPSVEAVGSSGLSTMSWCSWLAAVSARL